MDSLDRIKTQSNSNKHRRAVRGLNDTTALSAGNHDPYWDLVERTCDWIWEVNLEGYYTYSNQKVKDILGYGAEEIIGRTPFDLMPSDEAKKISNEFNRIAAAAKPFYALENRNIHKDGHIVWLETSGVPVFDDHRNLCGYRGIDRDITARKRLEEKLVKSKIELEKSVEKTSNDLLQTNTALKVILKRREEDKVEMGERLVTHVKVQVLPYLDKLKRTKMSTKQRDLVAHIETHLMDIVSPFAEKISSGLFNLTSMELKVATLVKDGKSNKDIAALLGVSLGTVLTHRHHLRKKLGLTNKKVNLRSHLLSLQ